jgi:hypothetical protein
MKFVKIIKSEENSLEKDLLLQHIETLIVNLKTLKDLVQKTKNEKYFSYIKENLVDMTRIFADITSVIEPDVE